MDTQSAFRALTAGTRFNKNKNKQAKQPNPFQVRWTKRLVTPEADVSFRDSKTSKASTSKVTLDQPLDGDSDDDTATTAKNSKKRKRDGSNSAVAGKLGHIIVEKRTDTLLQIRLHPRPFGNLCEFDAPATTYQIYGHPLQTSQAFQTRLWNHLHS